VRLAPSEGRLLVRASSRPALFQPHCGQHQAFDRTVRTLSDPSRQRGRRQTSCWLRQEAGDVTKAISQNFSPVTNG